METTNTKTVKKTKFNEEHENKGKEDKYLLKPRGTLEMWW